MSAQLAEFEAYVSGLTKEQKKELSPQLAEKTNSHLVTRVGNVVVLYRPKPIEPEPLQ